MHTNEQNVSPEHENYQEQVQLLLHSMSIPELKKHHLQVFLDYVRSMEDYNYEDRVDKVYYFQSLWDFFENLEPKQENNLIIG